MKEILFRGKRIDNGEWVYGLLLEAPIREYREYGSNFYIVRGYAEHNDDGWHFLSYLVDEETISQYTGLTDKNGKKIFEGDIHERENHFFVVKYGKYRDCETHEDGYGWHFEYTHRKGCEGFDGTENEYVNIIGNIYDNPELLKGGAIS